MPHLHAKRPSDWRQPSDQVSWRPPDMPPDDNFSELAAIIARGLADAPAESKESAIKAAIARLFETRYHARHLPTDGLHRRRVAALRQHLVSRGMTAWSKPDPAAISTPMPDAIRRTFESCAPVFDRYGSVIYSAVWIPKDDFPKATTAARAYFDLFARERGWNVRKSASAEYDELLGALHDHLLDRVTTSRVNDLLRARRFLVLQGPPGTGKTRMAEQSGLLFHAKPGWLLTMAGGQDRVAVELVNSARLLLDRLAEVATIYPGPELFTRMVASDPLLDHAVRFGLDAIGWIRDERGLGGGQQMDGLAWTLPLDRLWEDYVSAVVAADVRVRGGALRTSRRGETVTPLRWSTAQHSLGHLAPDVVVLPGASVWIVDAKYKSHFAEIDEHGWRQMAADIRDRHRAGLDGELRSQRRRARRPVALLVRERARRIPPRHDRGRLEVGAEVERHPAAVALLDLGAHEPRRDARTRRDRVPHLLGRPLHLELELDGPPP